MDSGIAAHQRYFNDTFLGRPIHRQIAMALRVLTDTGHPTVSIQLHGLSKLMPFLEDDEIANMNVCEALYLLWTLMKDKRTNPVASPTHVESVLKIGPWAEPHKDDVLISRRSLLYRIDDKVGV